MTHPTICLILSLFTLSLLVTAIRIDDYHAEACGPALAESYETMVIPEWKPAQRPAELDGDVNLALRGYSSTCGSLDVTELPGGGDDPRAPQLAYLFAEPRLGEFVGLHRVNNWYWDCDCRGHPIEEAAVTLGDLATRPGETIHVPNSGYEIGGGYEVLVLYAAEDRLTFKYTAEDDVVWGYTLHLENIRVDPALLALYHESDSAGRHSLPALRAGQAVGRACEAHIGVAVRDTGAFLDPRARQDWWRPGVTPAP